MHPALQHLLICISFRWDIRRLVILHSTLQTLSVYPTVVTVKVLSDHPKLVQKVLSVWAQDTGVWPPVGKGASFHVTSEGPVHLLAHLGWLNWVHRDVFARDSKMGMYTLYMHIEDDIHVPFQALLAWAEDEDFLRLHNSNHTRGFYSTVFDLNGDVHFSDNIVADAAEFSQHTTKSQMIGSKLFAQLPNPYAAMWVADQSLLSRYMRSRHWHVVDDSRWGFTEMGSGSVQFVDVPDGFDSSWLVPIDRQTLCPSAVAAIRHSSNKGPDDIDGPWGKLSVCDLFVK